ncbi:hypothetical protein Tco_0592125, partial [Tanacetum coccineum]
MTVLKALESSATFKDLWPLAKYKSSRIEDLCSNCGGVLAEEEPMGWLA